MKNKTVIIISVLSTLAAVGIISSIKETIDFPHWGFFFNPQEEFEKQTILSIVPSIELYNTKNGVYPKKLSDLEHISSFTIGHIQSLKYSVNKEQSNYYIHSKVKMPDDFWEGTGYSTNLKN